MSDDINLQVVREILDEELVFYTDIDNASQVYVEYPLLSGAKAFVPIKNPHFEAFLSYRYRKLAEEALCPPEILDYLEAKAEDAVYEQYNAVRIHRRVAGTLTNKILYFMADKKWQVVMVSPAGWAVGQSKKVKFLRLPADREQIMPAREGGDLLKLLRPFINLPDDDYILFVTFLVQAFSRSSSHYAAIVSSNKGTGKSTMSKLLRSLIDPSVSDVPLMPSSEGDLKTLLANTYLACLDNTATLSAKYSDILCAAITGTKEAKRKLYTDADQVVLNLHNLIVINGIDIVPRRSDLADRSLLFELRPISPSARRTDADFWGDFERKKSQIVGAIFDTLVEAMKVLPTLRLTTLERMADAYREMTAIAVALGIEQEEFQRIFKQNKDKLQDTYNQSNAIVEWVIEYMKNRSKVDLPASALYDELRNSIKGAAVGYPGSPSALSRSLNLERDALLTAGYYFDKRPVGGITYITLTRVPKNQQTKAQREYRQRRALLAEEDASIEE